MSQRSSLMHMQAVISCLGKSRFRVMVFRSMTQTLLHDLTCAMESVAARAHLV
jgi:sarcosine oxidase subunit gamma